MREEDEEKDFNPAELKKKGPFDHLDEEEDPDELFKTPYDGEDEEDDSEYAHLGIDIEEDDSFSNY